MTIEINENNLNELLIENDWYSERYFHKNVATSFKIKSILHSEKSKYQKIDVLDTLGVGRLLLLDGKTMVSDQDEFVYHEVMGHIPSMIHPKIKNVLIIGGGDGGIVREFVKHSEIERIDLVEIDERVIEVSKKFFPDCTSGLSDKRVNVLPQDGVEYIKTFKNFFDVIIIDSTDPEDFAAGLFTQEFYKHVSDALTDNGIMMAQTENPFYDEYGIKSFYDNLRNVYPVVKSFTGPMLIYPGVFWTFAYASKGLVPTKLNEAKIPMMRELEKSLKWYNIDWHLGAFNISNIHKKVTGC
jgi:spermidine synthase